MPRSLSDQQHSRVRARLKMTERALAAHKLFAAATLLREVLGDVEQPEGPCPVCTGDRCDLVLCRARLAQHERAPTI
ncbi:MAG: hypothetical protein OXG19_09680 [Chloroflexi bacterium]|nr:hypothetical protein [Chloroflexota bacterium]